MVLSLLSASAGLMVGNAPTMRQQCINMASIGDLLSSMDGPDLYWEEKGPLQNPPLEESDFKEYDKYDTFVSACQANGVDLNQPDITVFAPGNKACAEYTSTGGQLSADVCNYHIVSGVVPSSALSSADLTTKQGTAITYRRKFRKDFVDDAFTAVSNSPPRTSYKADIAADNGVIHMINEVIFPGWGASGE
jgi:uncharacterized surface protein with fasciclin (FAS1) repeats